MSNNYMCNSLAHSCNREFSFISHLPQPHSILWSGVCLSQPAHLLRAINSVSSWQCPHSPSSLCHPSAWSHVVGREAQSQHNKALPCRRKCAGVSCDKNGGVGTTNAGKCKGELGQLQQGGEGSGSAAEGGRGEVGGH
jgi:hypothetical protein